MKQVQKNHRVWLVGLLLIFAVGLFLIVLNFRDIRTFIQQSSDPFAADAVVDPPFTSLSYGIHTFLWWDEGSAGSQAAMVNRILNFTYIKQTFPWREMEPRPDEWDFTQSDRIVALAEEMELQLIVRLGQVPAWATEYEMLVEDGDSHDAPPTDLQSWGAYCGTVAERYAGRVAAYQIWNEPNLSREWGQREPNAAEYVQILAICSEAIRAVDSEAILISAGLSPTGGPMPIAMPDDIYFDAMYQAGFQEYVDVVGVHAPGFAPPAYGPDDAVDDGQPRWASFRRIEDLRKIMIQQGDAARQMAILEFGYTTDTNNPDYSWFAVNEEEQAQHIIDAYVYAAEHWRPWVGLMNLIYMPNPEWTAADEEWWWAIATPDGRLRPAFFALAEMDRYCGEQIVLGWQEGVSEEEYLEQRDTCP